MNKKIGTITFHWANNYGAVLQSYALQEYLTEQGLDAEIINYLPLRARIRNALIALKNRDFNHFKKNKVFNEFRRNELMLSKNKFYSNKQLFGCSDDYSFVIVGSDQIWNKSFFKKAERKPTLSYFLNFVGPHTKRISYAASFGGKSPDSEMYRYIEKELSMFTAVSVRENTGVDILKKIGIDSVRVLDPTLLLDREKYLGLLRGHCLLNKSVLCSYILHGDRTTARLVEEYVITKINVASRIDIKHCSVYQWIEAFATAEFIVTNSFHGTVFSILFHKPFITLLIPGSEMNDRLITLLDSLNLSNRMLDEFSKDKIDSLFGEGIDWDAVDSDLKDLRNDSERFLLEALY